jgi:hypothetical protein
VLKSTSPRPRRWATMSAPLMSTLSLARTIRTDSPSNLTSTSVSGISPDRRRISAGIVTVPFEVTRIWPPTRRRWSTTYSNYVRDRSGSSASLSAVQLRWVCLAGSPLSQDELRQPSSVCRVSKKKYPGRGGPLRGGEHQHILCPIPTVFALK